MGRTRCNPRVPTPDKRRPRIPRPRLVTVPLGRWYRGPKAERRLAADKLAVADAFPELRFRISEHTRTVEISGTLTLVESVSRIPTPVQIRIVLASGYPRSEPTAFDVGHRFEWGDARGHVNGDGSLCLWLAPRSPWKPDDAVAIVEFIYQVVLFCERYLVYEAGGKKKWPGGESKHGPDGYVEYVQESLDVGVDVLKAFLPALNQSGGLAPAALCPCGSGETFHSCHYPRVQAVVHTIGRGQARTVASHVRRLGR